MTVISHQTEGQETGRGKGESERRERSCDLDEVTRALSCAKINNIEILHILGSGGFGSVYKGIMEGGRTVAVKRLHITTKNEEARQESFLAERRILHLRHPHVVIGYAASPPDGNTKEALLIMEHVGDRNLQMIINDPCEEINVSRRLKYSHQLTQALQYVHSQFIVHLDVKPANILVTQDDQLKLGDFGCCQALEEDTGVVTPHSGSQLTGTFAYRAPELLRGDPPTPKADIYALGITLWQLLTRTLPYENENPHVVVYAVVAFKRRPAIPALEEADSPIEKHYQESYTQCWHHDPHQRPDATSLQEKIKTWTPQPPTTQQL